MDVKRLALVLVIAVSVGLGSFFIFNYLLQTLLSNEPYFKGAYFRYTVVSSTFAPPKGSSYNFEVVEVGNDVMRVTLEVTVGFTSSSVNYLAEKSWIGLISKIFEGKKISYEYSGKEKITLKNTLVECEKYVSKDTTPLGMTHIVTVYVYKKVPVCIIETYSNSIEASATLVLTDTNSIKIP
jgi:hypothetical protein